MTPKNVPSKITVKKFELFIGLGHKFIILIWTHFKFQKLISLD
jgi:hypothetical protein